MSYSHTKEGSDTNCHFMTFRVTSGLGILNFFYFLLNVSLINTQFLNAITQLPQGQPE